MKAVRKRESAGDAWGILSKKDAKIITPPIRWAISIRWKGIYAHKEEALCDITVKLSGKEGK